MKFVKVTTIEDAEHFETAVYVNAAHIIFITNVTDGGNKFLYTAINTIDGYRANVKETADAIIAKL